MQRQEEVGIPFRQGGGRDNCEKSEMADPGSAKTKKRKACAPASVTRPANNSAADPAMPSTSTYRPALLPTPTLPNQKTTSYFNLLKTENV